MAVNDKTWRKLPVAPRETTFDADDTIARISAWAKGSSERYALPFLWRNSDGPANNKNSYRLPIADIINGRMVLIPRAVFTAASIMSGAHGGLEETVKSEDERLAIKRVLTEIYNMLQEKYGDRRLEAPWLKGRTPDERAAEEKALGVHASGITAARKKRTKYVRDSKGRFSETPSAGAQLVQQLNSQARTSQQKSDSLNLRGRIELYEGQKLLSSKGFKDAGPMSEKLPVVAIIHDPDEGRMAQFDMQSIDDMSKWTGESPTSVETDQRGMDLFRRAVGDVSGASFEYQQEYNELIDDIESFGGFDDPTTLDLTPEQMRKVERYWELADDGTFQEGTLMEGYNGEVNYRIYGSDSGDVGVQITTTQAGKDVDWSSDKSAFYTAEEFDTFYTDNEEFFTEDSQIDPAKMPEEEFYEDDETPSLDPNSDEEDFELKSQDDGLTDETGAGETPGTPLTGQAALDSVPAKLTRAPKGHRGDYTGEALDAPEGAGDVRALSEYEGVEYTGINGFLRNPGPPKREPWTSDENWANILESHERFVAKNQARVDEIDKTMAVSKLPQPVRVKRVVKEGQQVWGNAWYGDVIDFNEKDFDVQDKQWAEWEAGKRPNLTGLKWKEDAYVSTSAKPDVSEGYKKWTTAPGVKSAGEPILLDIELPAGISAVQLSELETEGEILAQRGLDMEVLEDLGLDKDGFRLLRVRAEVPADGR